MAAFPSFAEFYSAVNRRDPFPWQTRLAGMVVTHGWPIEIGVPTGLGKTACIDVAIWSLAYQASQSDQHSLPTRIWYVVNRRLLVDAAYDHGERVARLLADPSKCDGQDKEAVEAVADALGSLGALGSELGPLHITRLRGGAARGARPPDPSQPAVIFATVPMFASRWLFRGYGSSTSMRPIDAALAGIDSLVLLDEAHLARPLSALLKPISQCDLGDPSLVVPEPRSRPVLVSLTATGDPGPDRFELDAADLAHPIVNQRLTASKPISLVETTEKKLTAALVESGIRLMGLQQNASAGVVFVNTPAQARLVTTEFEKHFRKATDRRYQLVLLTGRMRDREADKVRGLVLDPRRGAPAGRADGIERERHLVVVATQTLEVGADLDFDWLVTETAGVRALIQRLGRLNRLGTKKNAGGTICHPTDRKSWAVYGEEECLLVWDRLQERAEDAEVDLGPSRASDILGAPQDVPPRVGELLPVHLWEWAKTTLPPLGEAPVELFFQGFDEDRGRVSVCWRSHRPKVGVRLYPAVTQSESVEIPIWEIRETLRDRGFEDIQRLSSDRASLENVSLGSLSPGDHLVLEAADGMYDQHGWTPESDQLVLDVSLLNSGSLFLAPETLHALVANAQAEKHLWGIAAQIANPAEDEQIVDPGEEELALKNFIEELARAQPHPWVKDGEWQNFVDALGTTVQRAVDDTPYITRARPIGWGAGARVRVDAFDELSFDVLSSTLGDHLGSVSETASQVASRLGCADGEIEAIRMAGRLHDIGKADLRFQRWLVPHGQSDELMAKSHTPRHRIEAARVASGWPKGGRHELLSTRLIRAWWDANDQLPWHTELVLHLVTTHHGQGRPTTRVVEDADPLNVTTIIEGGSVTTSGDLSIMDWDQPRRFHSLCERYGYWGLALLESILRQADQAVSSAAEVV